MISSPEDSTAVPLEISLDILLCGKLNMSTQQIPVNPQVYQQKVNQEVEEMKKIEVALQNTMNNKQQLTEKKHENELVLKELEMLDEEAEVFKLVGPIIAKQDQGECKANVKNRIQYLTTEM